MNTKTSSSATSHWLNKATNQLNKAEVGTARLDALVLLEDLLGKDRTHLLAHPETKLTAEQIRKLDQQISRRIKHEPLAYIRGKTEFYGREFLIDSRVLEPRPESETMIDLLKNLHKDRPCAILDVGCGSGAIGITAVLEIPRSTVELIDIDPGCLAVTRQNIELHKVTAELTKSDLFNNIKRSPDVILANLPYVPDSYTINEAALNEPKIAIFGGPDGLDLYRRLFKQFAKNLQTQKVMIFTESLPFQHKDLEKIAQEKGFKQIAEDDFIQVFVPI